MSAESSDPGRPPADPWAVRRSPPSPAEPGCGPSATPTRRSSRAARGAVVWAGTAVALLALVAPSFLLPRRRTGGARHRGGGWHRCLQEPKTAHRRLGSGLLATSSRRLRARAVLCMVATIAVLVAVVGVVARSVPGAPAARREDVKFSQLPAFRGVSFADDLQREQRAFAGALPSDPVTGTSNPDFHGKYTNVVGGERRTAGSTCRGCPSAEVWLVGGSVAFGLGQRDEHTIASDLVALGERDGVRLRVRNLAVPGWTIDQEYLAVRARLDAGARAPALVVSVSGFNDVAAVFTELAVLGDQGGPPRVSQSGIGRMVAEGRGERDAGGVARIAAVASDRIRRSVGEFGARGAKSDVAVRFFFHPDALASPRQFEPVASVVRGIPASEATAFGSSLERTARAVAPAMVNLRHALDDVATSVYVDWAHTNEQGARVLAAAIWAELKAEVSAAAR